MATLSLRMRDDLKQKAQELAKKQGVSLNGFINSTLAAAIAQEETLTFLSDRLKEIDPDSLHDRVLKFMNQTRPGEEPVLDEINRAVGK